MYLDKREFENGEAVGYGVLLKDGDVVGSNTSWFCSEKTAQKYGIDATAWTKERAVGVVKVITRIEPI